MDGRREVVKLRKLSPGKGPAPRAIGRSGIPVTKHSPNVGHRSQRNRPVPFASYSGDRDVRRNRAIEYAPAMVGNNDTVHTTFDRPRASVALRMLVVASPVPALAIALTGSHVGLRTGKRRPRQEGDSTRGSRELPEHALRGQRSDNSNHPGIARLNIATSLWCQAETRPCYPHWEHLPWRGRNRLFDESRK